MSTDFLDNIEKRTAENPEQVLESRTLTELARDNPSAWRRVVGMAREAIFARTFRELIQQASEMSLRRFALDCAERALPLIEALNPGARGPRASVELGRLFVAGQADMVQIEAIRKANPEHYSAENELEALFDVRPEVAARLVARVLVEAVAKTAAADCAAEEEEETRTPFHLPMYGEAWGVERLRQLLSLRRMVQIEIP